MSRNNPNLYTLPTLPGTDPQSRRVMQDLVDQLNYLTGEVERLKERDLKIMPEGAARRENPQAGILTIPFFDGNGFIRVNPDGVIASYASPTVTNLDVSLLGGYFTDVTTYFTGANTNETDFSIKTMEPNTFVNNGDYIIVMSRVLYGGNANGKRYRFYFGGNVVYDTGVITPNGLSQLFFGFMYRETSTVLKTCFTNLLTNIAAGSSVSITAATPVDFTISNIIKTTGQNSVATANDVIQAGMIMLKGNARP